MICISLADNDDNGGINDAVDGVGVGVGVDDAVDKLLHLGESWIWRVRTAPTSPNSITAQMAPDNRDKQQ